MTGEVEGEVGNGNSVEVLYGSYGRSEYVLFADCALSLATLTGSMGGTEGCGAGSELGARGGDRLALRDAAVGTSPGRLGAGELARASNRRALGGVCDTRRGGGRAIPK